jgi:hypothetical protein
MPQMIAALFRDPAQARQGLQALLEMGIAQTRIVAVSNEDAREISSISGFRTLEAQDESGAALHGLDLPESDLRLFEQGLQRGCSLIAARVDRENLEEAARVLEMFDPVDLDSSSREWLNESGSGGGGQDQSGVDLGAPLGAGLTGGSAAGMTNTSAVPGMGLMGEAADDLGSSDLQTDEISQPNQGSSTTVGTGTRRGDARADREGVNELDAGSGPVPVRAGLLERHMHRGGRVWVFGSPGSGTA